MKQLTDQILNQLEMYQLSQLAPSDVSFPVLETGLQWKPPHQHLLFDRDEMTCVTGWGEIFMNRPHLSLIINWDPNEKNSPRDNVATYYCQPEVFVNVTHGRDVDISVYKGNGSLAGNISGIPLTYKKCVILGQSLSQGLVRSKFQCQCTEKCHIMIRVGFTRCVDEVHDDRICDLRVYD